VRRFATCHFGAASKLPAGQSAGEAVLERLRSSNVRYQYPSVESGAVVQWSVASFDLSEEKANDHSMLDESESESSGWRGQL
jgi:hypothetical protein